MYLLSYFATICMVNKRFSKRIFFIDFTTFTMISAFENIWFTIGMVWRYFNAYD